MALSTPKTDTNTTLDPPAVEPPRKKRRTDCPYLDTIDRTVLDFDFEKLCSVTLSNINVYACLVCGKYFQGEKLLMHA